MTPEQQIIPRANLKRTSPSTILLQGAHLIEPVSQGDYDGLCGLYCILNAIRLVLAPSRLLTENEVRLLFHSGIRFLDRSAGLSRSVRLSVPSQLWPGLAECVRSRAQQLLNAPIVFERPLRDSALQDPREAIAAIEALILSRRVPMVFMRGKYRHYSVIAGVSQCSIKLFDSYGYQWVRRSSCAAVGQSKSLHRFHFESLITAALG